MADPKLFRIDRSQVEELSPTPVQLEKQLQTLIEGNLETLLGIRFVKTEHSTGQAHGGRIDSLGLDENSSWRRPNEGALRAREGAKQCVMSRTSEYRNPW